MYVTYELLKISQIVVIFTKYCLLQLFVCERTWYKLSILTPKDLEGVGSSFKIKSGHPPVQ